MRTLKSIPAKATLALTIAAVFFLAMDLVLSPWADGGERRRAIYGIFDLNAEGAAPAWFSSMLWAGAAALAARCGLAAAQSRRDTARWMVLAALFLFLSADEAASIHEVVGLFLERGVSGSGPFYYVWVWYGIALVLVVGLLFFRFVMRLPARTRRAVFAAAAVYCAGALGVEMLGAAVEDRTLSGFPLGADWSQAIAVEEGLEMLGVILLIGGLLDFLALAPAETTGRSADGVRAVHSEGANGRRSGAAGSPAGSIGQTVAGIGGDRAT